MKRVGNRRLAIMILGSLTVAFACAAVVDGATQVPGIRPFYDSNPENVTFQEVRVPLRDGNTLSAYAVFPAGFTSFPLNSTPVTILSPGINGRKESMLWKGYNLAINGYVAIAVEARGNGDSSGIASFGIDEPADLSDTITWVLEKYQAINSSKVSLCGQSLGAMFSVLAACKDARVAASAVYHPPANFSSLLQDNFQIAQLVGGLPNFPLNDASLKARSPITWINGTLPHKMLFLHGENDTEIPFDNSLSLSALANASGHSDTYVIIRPGLNHPGNEEDAGSLALAIAWLNWSLGRGVVPSPLELWASASGIVIHDVPSGSVNGAGAHLVIAAVLLFITLFMLLRGPGAVIIPDSRVVVARESPSRDPRARQATFKRAAILVAMLGIPLGISLLIQAGITFVMWGYLLFFPAAVLVFLGIMMGVIDRQATTPWTIKNWVHGPRARNWASGMVSIAATAIFFSLTYDACANAIWQPGMSIFNSAFACYTSIFFLNFAVDLAFLKIVRFPRMAEEQCRHPVLELMKDTGIVFLWRAASIGIVMAFVPPIYFSGIPVAINLLIIAGIPSLMSVANILNGLLVPGTRSRTLVIVILVVVLATFLEYRMFRFF